LGEGGPCRQGERVSANALGDLSRPILYSFNLSCGIETSRWTRGSPLGEGALQGAKRVGKAVAFVDAIVDPLIGSRGGQHGRHVVALGAPVGYEVCRQANCLKRGLDALCGPRGQLEPIGIGVLLDDGAAWLWVLNGPRSAVPVDEAMRLEAL